MYGKPSQSNALVRIAKWALVALLVMQLLAASQITRIELRCGAACQKITSGQEY